ncbi:hypothetical protein MTP09_02235 [Chryseobacterium suipulveris]|uniref:Uncharacterized protein n=1 Tax=Chryseobacterium suipulveris TaxID=2929800 RepID=A0ABY4BQK9_9FLAO|nr:hypothetical protein [Chryseobacterium suipulveris]UOE41481.1 hypothetical protein MTP09_02235 [Chryseobacterium suipulveris]
MNQKNEDKPMTIVATSTCKLNGAKNAMPVKTNESEKIPKMIFHENSLVAILKTRLKTSPIPHKIGSRKIAESKR